MAEAGFSLRSATAEGTTGTVISALGQKNGLWTVWVTGASAVVELLYRGHQDAPWVPIAAITAGSEGGAATANYALQRYYRYLASQTVKVASAAGGSAQVTDFIQMVN